MYYTNTFIAAPRLGWDCAFFIYTRVVELPCTDKIVVSLEVLSSLQSTLEVLCLIGNILQKP